MATQASAPPNPTASVWNRGPPSQVNSGSSTPQINGSATLPAANGITVNLNGNGNGNGQNGTAPIPVGHSRKGSIMVGGGMDIKRGSIAFGTVDHPNPMLSSSPADPSMIGGHLADAVKSFGSIDADSADPDSVRAPARKTSNLASATSPNPEAPVKKTLDLHSLFTSKPNQQGDRRQSMGQNGQNGQNGPQYPNPQQFRPPPMMPGAQAYGQFRPPQSQMQYGMPQGYMQYPQGYNPGYYGQQQQYPNQQQQQQWAPQQHPQHQANMMSPRGLHPQASPAPLPQGLPNGSSPHLGPQQVRPSAPVPNGVPSTPSRQLQPTPVFIPNASTFTPGSQFSMSSGAASFTPRVSKAIKIARDDGTEIDLKALAVKPVTATPAATAPTAASSTPAKKPYTLPVVVRLESEEQKKERLKEEAEIAKIKAIEAAEDEERKERKERKAREAAEKQATEEKAKAEQAEKDKADAEAATKAEEAKAEKEKAEQAEKEKADATAEKEKADKAVVDRINQDKPPVSTPASPSAPPAGLPAKPSPIVTGSPALSSVEEHSALSSAQPINDLPSITYPNKYNPPNPSLNADAEPGKYRYDREFLLQFMQLCKEKPEGLPSLEEIGLEADTSSGFGGSRSGRGGSRPSPARGASTGLGIGIGRGGAGSGMGAFGTGNFGTLRGTSSEERYAKSISQSQSQRGGGRSGSSMQGLPPMAPSTSRGGRTGGRESRTGQPRGNRPPPPFYNNEPDVERLVSSNNSWAKARPTDNDESSPAFVERKVKALLNKLTQEKFDSISSQILEWANRSKNETDGMSLKLVIKQIFEKATDEAHWSEMYGRLCRKLLDDLDPEVTDTIDDKPMSGGVLFRKYLIGRCQTDFEAGWKARAEADSAAAAKSEEDKERLARGEKEKEEGKEVEAVMLSDEYYAAQKAKRRGLGLVQLVGELFKLAMITHKVINKCLQTLLTNITDPDEEDIESTCKLLTTVGGQFEAQAGDSMEKVIVRLQAISVLPNTSSRLKFMIQDIKDLKAQGWKGKKTASSVMTIAEIHQQAAREQAQKTAAAAQSTRESMSRGGSRAGRQRDGHDWQTPQQPVRLPQRPADMSNLGKITTSGAAPTFAGPSSVFSKRGKAVSATPPISRQASTGNMFSALNDAESAAEAAPERKKLNLKPRSVPMPGEEKEGDEEEDAEEEEGEVAEDEVEGEKTPGVMSEDAAKTKIASDMKELWGEKDVGGSRNPEDIAEYFKALPEERQSLLSIQLIDDAFRLSKYKDAEVIAKGLKFALEQKVATLDVLQKGIETHMTSLDDDSIDFPQAYKAMALFMRSLALSDDQITALVAKVDVYGTPRITPKDKLDKALGIVDEEGKA